jgi:predicted MFS family arabinose efflux permease
MHAFKFRAIILVAIAFILGCNEFIIVGILNDVGHQFNVPVASLGYLVTVFALVYAISTPFITLFVGRYSYFKSLMVLMVIFILSNTFSGLASSFFWLTVSRILTALVAGVIISLTITIANQIAPLDKRPWLIAWVFSGFSIASVFGVPIGTWISTTFTWRDSFWAITVVSLLTLALAYFSLPHKMDQETGNLRDQLSLLKDHRILVAITLPFFGSGGIYVFYTYLRPTLTTLLHFSTQSLSLLLFIYGLTAIVSNQLSGQIAQHGSLKLMPKVYAIEAILLFILPLVSGFQWIALAVVFGLGITMYLLNSPIQLHFLMVAEQDYPQSIVLASSLNSIFFNFGISLGSATGALVVTHLGLKWIGWGGAVYIAVAMVLVIWLNRLNARKPIKVTSHESL